MKKNHYTVLISSPLAGKMRQFSFNKNIIYPLLILFLILLVGNSLAIFKYRESTYLKKENSKLKAEKEEMEKVIAVVDDIKKTESSIRSFLGIEKPDSGMGGVGGEPSDQNYSDPPSDPFPPTENVVFPEESEQNVSPLAKALYLKKDLQEIMDELIDRKSEWNTKPTIMPVASDDYFISSGFGWRVSPFTGLREFHRGLDISAKRGTPIIAPAEGIVEETGKDLHLGKFIKINHGSNLSTLYGHLLQHNVKIGQRVHRGDLIGLIGNSGMSTGYHLHYEVRKGEVSVNPLHHILNLNTSNSIIAMRRP